MAPGRPAAISAAANARPARNVPRRLTASISSHSSGVRSSSGAIRYTPAELTSTSAGPPSSPAARATAAATAPGPDVAGDRRGTEAGGGGQGVRAPVEQHHLRALGQQPPRGGQPDRRTRRR